MTIQLTPEQEQAVRALKIDDLTARYIALRDAVKALEEDTKQKVAVYKAGMAKIENLMAAWLQVFGLESAPTPSGTAYFTTKTGASMGDREAFNRWVLADPEERLAFFTNAVSKDAVKQFMEAAANELGDGPPPPGINWYAERAVNFKR